MCLCKCHGVYVVPVAVYRSVWCFIESKTSTTFLLLGAKVPFSLPGAKVFESESSSFPWQHATARHPAARSMCIADILYEYREADRY